MIGLRTGPFLGHLGCLARLACATDKQCFFGVYDFICEYYAS